MWTCAVLLRIPGKSCLVCELCVCEGGGGGGGGEGRDEGVVYALER